MMVARRCKALSRTRRQSMEASTFGPPLLPNINPNVPGQEVDDLAAEVAAVARVLGLDERVTQELVSLQPRRAAWGIHSTPDPGCA